jgi:hypothetical protein
MSNDSWYDEAAKTVRILQLIVGAMLAGASIFLVVALTFGPQVKPPGLTLPIPLALVAFLAVVIGIITVTVVLWNISRKARGEIIDGTYQPVDWRQRIGSLPPDVAHEPLDPCRDAKYILSVFHYRTMVSVAAFEGWAFLATTAYLVEGAPLSLGLAVLLVLGVAAHFPTQSRAIAWVERQMEILQQERIMQ